MGITWLSQATYAVRNWFRHLKKPLPCTRARLEQRLYGFNAWCHVGCRQRGVPGGPGFPDLRGPGLPGRPEQPELPCRRQNLNNSIDSLQKAFKPTLFTPIADAELRSKTLHIAHDQAVYSFWSVLAMVLSLASSVSMCWSQRKWKNRGRLTGCCSCPRRWRQSCCRASTSRPGPRGQSPCRPSTQPPGRSHGRPPARHRA